LEFCSKCGSLLTEKKCKKCGTVSENEIKLECSQKINPKKEVVVIAEDEIEVHPVVDATCPKCEHNKAYFWTKQTRAGDEAETSFYKCVKCKNTWRVYK